MPWPFKRNTVPVCVPTGIFSGLLTVESLDRDLSSQGSLRESDRDRGVKIAALALELFVLGYVNNDIEISGRTAVGAGLAFTLNAQTRTGLDARRDFHFHRFFTFDAAGAFAIATWRADDAARAATYMTRSRYGKEALLITHLARAAAGLAVLRIGTRRSADAFTFLAGFQSRDTQLRRHAGGGFLERNFEIVAQVRAALCRRPARARASATKDITEAKQIAEDVFDAAKAGRAPACSRAARYTRMPKTIVTPPLLGIGKDRVSFGGFLEFFFGGRVVGVFVGMMAHRQPAIGALDFLIGRRATNFQNFVVISFAHSGI